MSKIYCLIYELIRFIPVNLKWDNTLISKFFNFLIIKFQRKWRIYINKLRDTTAQMLNDMILKLNGIVDPGSHINIQGVVCLNNLLDG
uniref:Uncharacterized protein n=1 Tax=Meloidogyne enterolobii TaxID=390850 RepID=A0A6V7UU22_MELEN|nr:unnamed protein product [Meloidogyne enterolobii]